MVEHDLAMVDTGVRFSSSAPFNIPTDITSVFLCVSGMAHILSVKVRPRVFVAKCSKPQAEGREAGVKEAV